MRILFISNTRLGDAILTTGVLKHLIDKHPNSEITVVTSYIAKQIFEPIPQVANIICYEKQKYKLHWLKLYFLFRKTRWDLIVDFKQSGIALILNGNKKYWRKNVAYKKNHILLQNASLLNVSTPLPSHFWCSKRAIFEADNVLAKYQNHVKIALSPT